MTIINDRDTELWKCPYCDECIKFKLFHLIVKHLQNHSEK